MWVSVCVVCMIVFYTKKWAVCVSLVETWIPNSYIKAQIYLSASLLFQIHRFTDGLIFFFFFFFFLFPAHLRAQGLGTWTQKVNTLSEGTERGGGVTDNQFRFFSFHSQKSIPWHNKENCARCDRLQAARVCLLVEVIRSQKLQTTLLIRCSRWILHRSKSQCSSAALCQSTLGCSVSERSLG